MEASATALMMAIYHGLSGVLEALLRAKPDVNITATGVCLITCQYLIWNIPIVAPYNQWIAWVYWEYTRGGQC